MLCDVQGSFSLPFPYGQAVRTHNWWKGACVFAGATLLAVGAPLLVAEGAAAVAAGAIVNGARIGAGAASVGASMIRC